MRRIPVFRWVLTLGLALITWSAALYVTAPGMPELEQVELTVLEEKPDGTCRVAWADPFAFDDEREAPYRCDAGRSSSLKAPEYDPDTGFGWDSGFVVAEGPDKGELYSLDEDGKARDEQIERSDGFVTAGLVLTIIGLAGGNIRSARRIRGVRPGVLRRATELKEAADAVARDHRRALEAVRTAWAPLHRELVDGELDRIPVSRMRGLAEERLRARELEEGGVRTVRDVLDAGTWALAQFLGMERDMADETVAEARRTADAVGREVAVRFDARGPEPRTTALLAALRVLVDAGPDAREVGRTGEELAARLEPLLITAEPSSGVREMLRTGTYERDDVLAAVTKLRLVLAEAGREGLAERFAQASVDLLRGPDAGADELATWADFESRPEAYYAALAEAVEDTDHGEGRASARTPDGAGLTGSRRRRG
ncbi:hypothetical protein [Streptomyces sp. f150]|uniref:hypothetical protein n=1 Tax=Streptomyces sp. f150 TaxID=1827699 RepID=UPI00117DBEB7|nr:hypothetical protein [Streptomyces sp. f150]